MMYLAAEQPEHSPGVLVVGWFAQDLPGALDDGIAGDQHASVDPGDHVGGLLPGHPAGIIRGPVSPAAGAALRPVGAAR